MGGARWPSVGTLHAAGDVPLPSGTSRAHGDALLPSGAIRACGDRNPVPDGVECPRPGRHAPRRAGCPRLRGSVPAWGDTHSVVRPRRRGTSLWTVPPRIEDVPFDRGLRSPTEGDGPGAVVWGRSTSWAQNAVPDGPGQPRVVVGTGQGRTRACWSTLPTWGCAVRRTGPAARRRCRDQSEPACATSWWSSPRVRVLVAHDGLACQFRGAPA